MNDERRSGTPAVDDAAFGAPRSAAEAGSAWRRYLRATGGGVGLLWLVYLLNVPLVLFFMEAEAWRWWLSAAVVAVFLASYLPMLTVRGDRPLLWHGAAQTLLAALAVPVTPGANVIWIYAAGALGNGSTVRRGLLGVAAVEGVVVLHAAGAALALGWQPGVLASVYLPPLVFAAIIGVANAMAAQQRRADARLRRAYDEVERLAAVAERERIARDLHDLLGHTLSLVRVKAELASKLAAVDPVRAAEEMRAVERTAREALREVRAAVSGYRARGLDAEIAAAKLVLESAGIELRFERTVAAGGVPAALEPVLAAVLREAVTNVVRHAGASRCRVRLERRASPGDRREGLALTIDDDGIGAGSPPGTPEPGAPEAETGQPPAGWEPPLAGNGLRNAAERLRAVGGRLLAAGPVSTGAPQGGAAEGAAEGAAGGFTLVAWVPLAAAERPAASGAALEVGG